MRPLCFIHTCLALCLGLVVLSPSNAAPARQQAPGYFRYAVGDFTVTALNDGVLDLNPAGFHGMPIAKMRALIERAFLLRSAGVQTAVNAYLVDTGEHRVLVDAGTAKCFGDNPKLGHLQENLRASGTAPEDIDTIVITHLHGDHFCSLTTEDGKRAFPNATVWVAEEEAAFWLSEQVANSALESRRGAFKQARDITGVYRAAGAFRTFKADEAIIPGMRVVASHGHTPGHTGYLFESKDQSLLVWGDIVHCHPVQFARPEVSMSFDTDEKQAVATRKALFARLAKDGTAIAGAHLPFPGIGHIRKDGKAYAWVPVEFGPLTQ